MPRRVDALPTVLATVDAAFEVCLSMLIVVMWVSMRAGAGVRVVQLVSLEISTARGLREPIARTGSRIEWQLGRWSS
jgi:hypothetical protein